MGKAGNPTGNIVKTGRSEEPHSQGHPGHSWMEPMLCPWPDVQTKAKQVPCVPSSTDDISLTSCHSQSAPMGLSVPSGQPPQHLVSQV